MWRRVLLNQTVRNFRCISTSRKAGVLFDVDGVLLRGGHVLPAARRAIRKLTDADAHFLFPVVFVTNAGSCHRNQKAQQLSQLLEVQIAPEQVVLSHSPLQTLKHFHQKSVLVSGQGPVSDIARSLGFVDVVTMEQLTEQFPLLDMVEHKKRPRARSSDLKNLPRIEAIVLFGEPVRWEANLQLLVDVLLTNGKPDSAYDITACSANQLPVLACNTDLLWMADAPSPRFGHGMFLSCLESVYRKLTGSDLVYTALLGKPSVMTYRYAETLLREQNQGEELRTVYAVGDNLMTDIYGANLYNRYLAATATSRLVAEGTGSHVTQEDLVSTATQCQSILVCTGVYNPRCPLPSDGVEAELVRPSHTVEDVEEAVDLMLLRETH